MSLFKLTIKYFKFTVYTTDDEDVPEGAPAGSDLGKCQL